MGWNTVEQSGSSPLFATIPNHSFFYFVHSYAAPLLPEETIGVTRYGIPFTSAFQRDNMFGVQFHPEKSGEVGLQLISNFMAL
jgi:glutamine amidotransferase